MSIGNLPECFESTNLSWDNRRREIGDISDASKTKKMSLVAKDCTPEIDTSETIVDFQWHFPMDVQWYFPVELHLSVVCFKGLSLAQWIFTGVVQRMFSGIIYIYICTMYIYIYIYIYICIYT